SEHPIYDFIDRLVRMLEARPIRIVLEYVPGAGLAGSVAFSGREGETSVPCYPSDALALAKRAGVPIYVSGNLFTHLRPSVPVRRITGVVGTHQAARIVCDQATGPPGRRLARRAWAGCPDVDRWGG